MTPAIRREARNAVKEFSNSVRYFGASALIVLIRSSICALSSSGGGDARLANGSPTARKNSSSPAGAARQSRCAGPPDRVPERVGGIGRNVDRRAGPHRLGFAAEGDLELALEEGEHLLEIMPMRRRPAAVGHDHVDQAVAPRRLSARHENAIGVAHDRDMADRRDCPGRRLSACGQDRRRELQRSRHRSLAVSSGDESLEVRIMACVS